MDMVADEPQRNQWQGRPDLGRAAGGTAASADIAVVGTLGAVDDTGSAAAQDRHASSALRSTRCM